MEVEWWKNVTRRTKMKLHRSAHTCTEDKQKQKIFVADNDAELAIPES
jgi:hypothetical protein